MKAAYYSVFGAALLVCFLNRFIDLIYNKQNAAKEGRGERDTWRERASELWLLEGIRARDLRCLREA